MKYIIPIIFAIAILWSCATVKTSYIQMDVYKPAIITFPEDVKTVLLVDNAVFNTTVSEESEDEETLRIFTDTAKAALLRYIQLYISEEGYFDKIDVYPTILNHDINRGVKNLSISEIERLCKETGADALISFDKLEIPNSFKSEITYTPDNYEQLISGFGLVENTFSSLFRIYDKNGMLIDAIESEIPLVFYLVDEYDNKNAYAILMQMTVQALPHIADDITTKLIPTWSTQERVCFYMDKESETLIKENKWAEAAEKWGELFDGEKDKNKKVLYAYNIALANEYLGDIDNALWWIELAKEMAPVNSKEEEEYKVYGYASKSLQIALYVSDYYKILEKRYEDMLNAAE